MADEDDSYQQIESMKKESFECKKNKNGECYSCSDALTGKCINYTKNHPSFLELDKYDKMNYAVYMINYDVEKNKSFAEGAITAKGGYNQFATIEMILKPQRLLNFLLFIAFVFIVLMVVQLFLLILFNASPVKKSVCTWMIICLLGIMCLTYLLSYVADRVVTSLENINYNIK
jgi:hypothetical protein